MRKILLFGFMLVSFTMHAESKQTKKKPNADAWGDDRHIATFVPFAGMFSYSNFNPGAGVDYEYIISKAHGIGFHIPLMVGYVGPEQGDFGNGGYRHSTIYTSPGIRFHTGGPNSDVDFITGPSVLIGNIHFNPDEVINGSPYNYSMVGLLADNTLNFYRNHFVFGFDVRLGTMIERQESTRFFIHFGMHFGGKF